MTFGKLLCSVGACHEACNAHAQFLHRVGRSRPRSSTALNYYDAAQGKTGTELRQALHSIIKGHTVIRYDSSSYVDSVDALGVLDEDPANNNNVILIYSGWPVPKSNYGVSGWDREHLWPFSYGFDTNITTTWPALRDLFNLWPCDSGVNSSRGNKYYDFSDPADPNYRNPAHTNAPLCSTDSDSWEPPDSMKGDIARAMFYMDVRYAGESSSEPDSLLTDNVGSITNGSPFMGRLSALLRWHQLDPVDASERNRNDLIYERYQRNRNPFVDYPEWADLVYRPKLFITTQSNAVSLFWETNWTNVVLETSSQPDSGWLLSSVAPSQLTNQFVVVFTTTNAQRFFRLRLM